MFFIGHVSKDILSNGNISAGGGVTFGSVAARLCKIDLELDIEITGLTIANIEDRKYFEGLELSFLDSPFTTSFENIYLEGVDNRIQKVHEKGRSFLKEDLPLSMEICIINALWFGEFPEELLKEIETKKLIIDAQGFIRHITEEGDVIRKQWKNIEKFIKKVDLLKVDEREIQILSGLENTNEAIQWGLDKGVGAIICTSMEWVKYFDNTTIYESKLIPPKTPECRTGRGDTITASFLLAQYKGFDIQKSLDYAAKVTSNKMQHIGVLLKQDFLQKSELLKEEEEDL